MRALMLFPTLEYRLWFGLYYFWLLYVLKHLSSSPKITSLRYGFTFTSLTDFCSLLNSLLNKLLVVIENPLARAEGAYESTDC